MSNFRTTVATDQMRKVATRKVVVRMKSKELAEAANTVATTYPTAPGTSASATVVTL